MTRTLTCIICPKGCSLTADIDLPKITVTGNTCPKGEEYAINECLHPVRTVTSTIRIGNRSDAMLSVKTETPIAKQDMFTAMEQLRKLSVDAPVCVGDVIHDNICGSRILATMSIK